MTDLYVLDVKGSDIVLGVQWLVDLGTIMTNYKEFTMQLTHGGKEVRLQGEGILSATSLKERKLNKMIAVDTISDTFSCKLWMT